MKKSERTRQYIIEKTAPVFNQLGFEGTSLSVLQEVTGLTKGGLYGNFRDKEEIALEAFHYSVEKVRDAMRAELKDVKTAREKLLTLISFFARYVFEPPVPGGCPLLNHAVEADDAHTTMKEAVADRIGQVISFIANVLDEGKRKGEFRRDVKSRELAVLFFTSIEGAIMISRVSGSDSTMRIVVRNCKKILDQISK